MLIASRAIDAARHGGRLREAAKSGHMQSRPLAPPPMWPYYDLHLLIQSHQKQQKMLDE
jgi:hypothetical protein